MKKIDFISTTVLKAELTYTMKSSPTGWAAGTKVYFILYLRKFKQVPPPAQHFFKVNWDIKGGDEALSPPLYHEKMLGGRWHLFEFPQV